MITFTYRILTLLVLFVSIGCLDANAQSNRAYKKAFEKAKQFELAEQQRNNRFKFGHTNFSDLFDIMPEQDTYMNKLKQLSAEHGKKLDQMSDEYKKKVDDYIAMQNKLDKSTLDKRGMEIDQLIKKIQDYREMYEKELKKARDEAIKSIMDKINNAARAVEQKYGYTHIFDISDNTVLYYNQDQSTDVTDLMKKELGLK